MITDLGHEILAIASVVIFGSILCWLAKPCSGENRSTILGWVIWTVTASLAVPWLVVAPWTTIQHFIVIAIVLFPLDWVRNVKITSVPWMRGNDASLLSVNLGRFFLTITIIVGVVTWASSIYIYIGTPLFAWDSLWFWAPQAINVLEFQTLDTRGHPSFGVYSLATASNIGRLYNLPVTNWLWVFNGLLATFAVGLSAKHGSLAFRVGIAAVLLGTMPFYANVISSIGYFDLHLATCTLLILTVMRELGELQQGAPKTILVFGLFSTVAISLSLKSSAMTPLLACALSAIWLFLPRKIFLIAASIGIPIILSALYFGFEISILGREASLDWGRSPTLMAPGLWQDFPKYSSLLNVFKNYFTALLVNQSFSTIFLAFFFIATTTASNIKSDIRFIFLVAFFLLEIILQVLIPYFFDHASIDTRFTRSLLPPGLVALSLIIDAGSSLSAALARGDNSGAHDLPVKT